MNQAYSKLINFLERRSQGQSWRASSKLWRKSKTSRGRRFSPGIRWAQLLRPRQPRSSFKNRLDESYRGRIGTKTVIARLLLYLCSLSASSDVKLEFPSERVNVAGLTFNCIVDHKL